MTTGHCLVTGAARGIGRALAERMAAELAPRALSLVDIEEGEAQRVAQAIGPHATAFGADLADLDSLPALVERCVAAHGPIELLVNNAGIIDLRPVAGFGWDRALRLLEVDLLAPLRLVDLTLGAMLEAGRGVIINVASMAAVAPLRGAAYYGAAKAGLANASEVLAAEVREAGVRVVTVYPGPVTTALEQGARAQITPTRLGRLLPTGQPDELARLIVRAVQRGEPRVVYPRAYELARLAAGVAGAITARFSPRTVDG
jgi:short-subunit dehydrogenase